MRRLSRQEATLRALAERPIHTLRPERYQLGELRAAGYAEETGRQYSDGDEWTITDAGRAALASDMPIAAARRAS